MRFHLTIALIVFSLLPSQAAHSATETITFSEYPLGLLPYEAYRSRGILFNRAVTVNDPAFPQNPVLATGSDIFFNTMTIAFVNPSGGFRPVNSVTLDIGPFVGVKEMAISPFKMENSLLVPISTTYNTKVGIEKISISSVDPIYQVRLGPIKYGSYPYKHWSIDNVTFDAIGGGSCPTVSSGSVCAPPRIIYTLPSFTVPAGKRIDLKTNINPSYLASSKWFIGGRPSKNPPEKPLNGRPIADYTLSNACSSLTTMLKCTATVTELDLATRTQPAVSFFWTTGGPATVEYDYTLTDGRSGTLKVNFNVVLPTTAPGKDTISVTAGDLKVDPKFINILDAKKFPIPIGGGKFITNGLFLSCGNGLKGPCVSFAREKTLAQPVGYSGDYQWVQVVLSTRTKTQSKSSGSIETCEDSPHLDKGYPYSKEASTNDAPNVILLPDDKWLEYYFQARMHLLWKPNTQNAIYVPIGTVTWSWSGTADQGSSWKVRPGTTEIKAPYSAPVGLPRWSTVKPKC